MVLKESILSGVFGVAIWISAFITGGLLVYATGIPALSGIITGILYPFFLVILDSILKKTGALLTAFTIYGILAIPTMLMGPPGVYKIFIAIIGGIILELIIWITKHKTSGYYLSFIVFSLSLIGLGYGAMILLNLPGIEKFKSVFITLTIIFSVDAVIGTYLGNLFFEKSLKSRSMVKMFQDEN